MIINKCSTNHTSLYGTGGSLSSINTKTINYVMSTPVYGDTENNHICNFDAKYIRDATHIFECGLTRSIVYLNEDSLLTIIECIKLSILKSHSEGTCIYYNGKIPQVQLQSLKTLGFETSMIIATSIDYIIDILTQYEDVMVLGTYNGNISLSFTRSCYYVCLEIQEICLTENRVIEEININSLTLSVPMFSTSYRKSDGNVYYNIVKNIYSYPELTNNSTIDIGLKSDNIRSKILYSMTYSGLCYSCYHLNKCNGSIKSESVLKSITASYTIINDKLSKSN